MKEPRQVNSLVKGLKILECVAKADQGLRVVQIAEELSIQKSNLSLFLNSLISTGYVIRSPADNKYYIAEKLQEIAGLIHPNQYSELSKAARPEMEKILCRFDENIYLVRLCTFHIRIIIRLLSNRPLRIVSPMETTYIPHVTAGGKSILAFLPKARLKTYLKNVEFKRFTKRSITTPEGVQKEIEEVRRKGYAVNRGEYQEEIMAVAAPIFINKAVSAALVLQFPTHRHKQEELETNAQIIVEAANHISEKCNKKLA